MTQDDDRGYDDLLDGDPRRCAIHPHIATSSPDGMFDAPCGECEAQMDEEAARYEHHQRLAIIDAIEAERWAYDTYHEVAL